MLWQWSTSKLSNKDCIVDKQCIIYYIGSSILHVLVKVKLNSDEGKRNRTHSIYRMAVVQTKHETVTVCILQSQGWHSWAHTMMLRKQKPVEISGE